MGGSESQRGSCPVERGRSIEEKVEKNKLMWEACFPSGAMDDVWSRAAAKGYV